jgi:hypothetical protein
LSYRRAAELLVGQTGWTLHQFRHSALMHLAEDNVQLPPLMAKSRHRSLRTLQRYARPGPDAVPALKAAHDRRDVADERRSRDLGRRRAAYRGIPFCCSSRAESGAIGVKLCRQQERHGERRARGELGDLAQGGRDGVFGEVHGDVALNRHESRHCVARADLPRQRRPAAPALPRRLRICS